MGELCAVVRYFWAYNLGVAVMMRAAFGALLGVLLAYLFGAFVAYDFDIGEWLAPWRFIVALAAFIAALAMSDLFTKE